jgi:transposase
MSLLSVKCKLIPDASTAEKLSRTVNQFANACNYALAVARRHRERHERRLEPFAEWEWREAYREHKQALERLREVA